MKKRLNYLLILGLLIISGVTQQTVLAASSVVDRDNETVTVEFHGREAPDDVGQHSSNNSGYLGHSNRNPSVSNQVIQSQNQSSELINGRLTFKKFLKQALLPQTGEQANFWLTFVGALLLSVSSILILKRRRQHEES